LKQRRRCKKLSFRIKPGKTRGCKSRSLLNEGSSVVPHFLQLPKRTCADRRRTDCQPFYRKYSFGQQEPQSFCPEQRLDSIDENGTKATPLMSINYRIIAPNLKLSPKTATGSRRIHSTIDDGQTIHCVPPYILSLRSISLLMASHLIPYVCLLQTQQEGMERNNRLSGNCRPLNHLFPVSR
jgi:hypothetical protein